MAVTFSGWTILFQSARMINRHRRPVVAAMDSRDDRGDEGSLSGSLDRIQVVKDRIGDAVTSPTATLHIAVSPGQVPDRSQNP